MRIGVDFGTTNTVVSVMRDGRHEIVKIGRRGARKASLMKSLLYFPERGQGVLFDDAALQAYMDEPEQGRLMRSIKKLLPQKSFEQTRIYRRRFDAVDLIALFLREVHRRIKAELGLSNLPPVDVSRPVAFSADPEIDAMAEGRLLEAYRRAGFEVRRVVSESESAAASMRLTHEGLDHQSIALVDLGGGTTDVTLMRREGAGYEVARSGGVYVGGDSIDSGVMNRRIVPILGEGTRYTLPFDDKQVLIPAYIWRSLGSWYDISFLARGDTARFLRSILSSAEAPDKLSRLITLIEDNLGLELFQEIERVKIALSSEARERFAFDADGALEITFEEERGTVEGIIEALFIEINALLERVRRGEAIDAVALTGGTSQAPAVEAALRRHLRGARIIRLDPYHAVAAGLTVPGGSDAEARQ